MVNSKKGVVERLPLPKFSLSFPDKHAPEKASMTYKVDSSGGRAILEE